MYIKVKVTPGAKKEEYTPESKDTFVIRVKEKAERNMANKRVCELVAQNFGLKIGDIRIISGHHSHSKILSIKT